MKKKCHVTAARVVQGLMLVLMTSQVAALDPDKALTQYILSSWGTRMGLPQNSVRAITQGPHGYLWVGTYEGVALFDGLRFRRFVPHRGPSFQKTINALLTSADGTVWVATEGGGLYAVSPQSDVRQWRRGEGLPDSRVTAMADGLRDTLWFAVAGRVFRMQRGMPKPVQGLPQFKFRINTLYVDGAGMLWIGTNGGSGLYSWQDGQLRHYGEQDGFSPGRVGSIIGDGHNGLWIGSFRGLWRHSAGGFKPVRRDKNRVLWIKTLWLEKNGTLWMGTYGGGLERWVRGKISVFSTTGSPHKDYVQSLFMDRQGNLWFGASESDQGLRRLREGPILTWSTSEGLSGEFVRSVARDRAGDIWVGTDGGGLDRIRRGRVDLHIGTKDGLLSDTIRALLPDGNGGLWVGAFAGGVNHWSEGRIQSADLPGGPPSSLVRSLFLDHSGALWVGTGDAGVARYRNGQRQLFDTDTGLPGNDVRAVTEFAGQTWIGTGGTGVVVLDQDRVAVRYGVADGLPGNAVFTFFPDGKSRLWAGTAEGLALYQDGRWRSVVSAAIPQAVFQILRDRSGLFWLCTNAGIVRMDPRAITGNAGKNGRDLKLRVFNELDGMRSPQCNGATQPVATQDQQGRLWFPTLDGIAMIDPQHVVMRDTTPQVHIEALLPASGHAALLEEETLQLPPGTRDMEIRYNGLDLHLPERIRFRYRLLGLGETWIDAGSRRRAFFTNLPPGSFEFQVTAANGNGVWSQTPARTRFSIASYFYQTGWFLMLLAITAAMSLYAAYRWRVRRISRVRRRLQRRVDERTEALSKANSALEDTLRELRASQEQLLQSRKLAAMGKLVAGVAHQLNTPIGNCTTVGTLLRDEYLQLSSGMEQGGISRSRFQAFIAKANTGFELLCGNLAVAGRLVGKFRKLSVDEYSRSQERFELGPLLAELGGMFGARIRQAGHELHLSCPDGLWVAGSRRALAEVFEQLVENTLTHAFVAPGGRVAMTVSSAVNEAVLRFQDNGVGIPRQHLQKVFEPFSGSVHGTSALGLSIVHNLVSTIMGGEVSCEAVADGGVCFIIRLRQLD